jgi:hypothetical protein
MRGPIVAAWLEAIGPVEKILAVFGAAVLGGLLLGYFTQVLVRLVSLQKMPRWARNVVRLLGAVATGWLVALWLFGGGGPGVGGTGGWGFGSGTGQGTSTAKAPEGGPPTSRPSPNVPPAENTAQVEVLGPDALERLPGKPDARHCYRVEVKGEPQLMTLPEVMDFLRGRLKEEPPLRQVRIVLYKDSPAKDVPLVRKLIDWASDLPADGNKKMQVDVLEPGTNAP